VGLQVYETARLAEIIGIRQAQAIRRRHSAIQYIGPDNVFLPSRYYLASMNAVLGMHAMGEAQDRSLWCMNWDN